MMEKYVKAEMEVIEFETEDVITTSGFNHDDGGFGWEEEDEGW